MLRLQQVQHALRLAAERLGADAARASASGWDCAAHRALPPPWRRAPRAGVASAASPDAVIISKACVKVRDAPAGSLDFVLREGWCTRAGPAAWRHAAHAHAGRALRAPDARNGLVCCLTR
jgi:hypothetical protein